jgi:hypothetical protein
MPVNGPLGNADLLGNPSDCDVLTSTFNNQFSQSVYNLLSAQRSGLPFLSFPGHKRPSFFPHGFKFLYTKTLQKATFFVPTGPGLSLISF